MAERNMPEVKGFLRDFRLSVPEEIYKCTGIKVLSKRIKSLLFSTDASIIKNSNADAIIAVYPFTPQPVITQAVMTAADVPVFAGVGGGLTKGQRVINLALHAEFQGAYGVVVNSPTQNNIIEELKRTVDIPVIVTIASDADDIDARVSAGADIFNVSAAAQTPDVVRKIKSKYPDFPVIATGGQTKETIAATIEAGANAITWTPPSNGEIFKDIMDAYRHNLPHP